MNEWYRACTQAAAHIRNTIPETYQSRTFPGIIGDIKALPPKKALSLISRKKGLGTRYAYLYLTHGIDGGKGYQACATEALASVLGSKRKEIINGRILDAGCAVGVTAGILGLEHVTGFDLFSDLLVTAKLVDFFTGRENSYIVADMTQKWPFACTFDTVVCGLVCHHLKTQADIARFFSEVNRVLRPGGSLVMTMPSDSVSTASQLMNLEGAIEQFGFSVTREYSGLVVSNDSTHSLFWMFLIIAEKVSEEAGTVFISPGFAFPLYRTPIMRAEKGTRAKETAKKSRTVRHEYFSLINSEELEKEISNRVLVYEIVAEL